MFLEASDSQDSQTSETSVAGYPVPYSMYAPRTHVVQTHIHVVMSEIRFKNRDLKYNFAQVG